MFFNSFESNSIAVYTLHTVPNKLLHFLNISKTIDCTLDAITKKSHILLQLVHD